MPDKKESVPAEAAGVGQEATNQQFVQLVRAVVAELQRNNPTATTQALSTEEQQAVALGDAAFQAVINGLRLEAAPATLTVTEIYPARGKKAGGESVEVKGTGFLPGAAVYFGEAPARSVVFDSREHLTVTTPLASANGAVDVTVYTYDGAVVAQGGFDFEN
jgi:hypothetical protein